MPAVPPRRGVRVPVSVVPGRRGIRIPKSVVQ